MKILTVFILMALQLTSGAGQAQRNILEDSVLKITGIDPTVLFKKEKNNFTQAVDITIENRGPAIDARLKVRFASLPEFNVDLGIIKAGKENYRFFIPEISDTVQVEFLLGTQHKTEDRFTMEWTPRKHWEVCMIPISHHDLGYTNTIERVLLEYSDIYEDVLRFCEVFKSRAGTYV